MNIVFSNFLKGEIKKWQEYNVIDDESIAKLQNFYNFSSLSKPKFSIVILGYFFFGLALLTLIGANWEDIPRFIRLVLVLGVTFCTQFFAFFAYKNGQEKRAISLFFLGNLFFGASIALISQIYHLGGNATSLFFWWSFGVLLVAICFCEKYLSLQTLILASIYLWLSIQWPVTSNFSLFYFLILIFTFFVSLKEKSQLLFILSIFGFYFWLCASFDNDKFRIFVAPTLMLFFAHSLKNSKLFFASRLYEISIFSSVLFLIFLHFIGYHPFNIKIPLLASLIVLVFSILLFYISFKEQNYFKLALVAVFLLFTIIQLDVGDKTLIKVLISIISVIFALRLILQKYIKLGFILLTSSALIRYFDLAGDYIGTSLLFMLFGSLMIIVSKRIKNEN